MKLDDERIHHNHMSHQLASEAAKPDGCLQVDAETGWEGKHDRFVEKEIEQTNPPESSYVEVEHWNGNKTRQMVSEDASYDKDVMEIKLPDTVVSSNYGGHFVKDVCIDDGAHPHQKASEEKVADKKASSNFDCSVRDASGDPREELRGDSTKAPHDLKPNAVLVPVDIIRIGDGNTEEQYSFGKVHALEGEQTAADFMGDLDDQKSSLKQLLGLEGVRDAQVIAFESSEDHKLSLDGQRIDQISANGCHEVGAVASETGEVTESGLPTEVTASGFSEGLPEQPASDAALATSGSNQIKHYNPFIAYGSLDETWEPGYSLPPIDSSAEPTCGLENIDSFRDIVNGASKVLNEVETDEARDEAVSSCSTDAVHASETSEDRSKNCANEVIAAAATSETSDVDGESHPKCKIHNGSDMPDFNPRDAENGQTRSKNNTDSKNSAGVQNNPVVEGTDGAKVSARTTNRNPFESSFSGPSIASGPASSSGHIPYSGNISLRSDSSTTSTRSFAFPVLQTEWNSSPVKMAKADRRRLRRHRGWRNGLLCCKF